MIKTLLVLLILIYVNYNAILGLFFWKYVREDYNLRISNSLIIALSLTINFFGIV